MSERITSLYEKLETSQIRLLKLGLFLMPLLFLLFIVILKLYARTWYRRLAIEDGPLETLTSLAYFITFLIGISMAIQFRRQNQIFYAVLYLVASIGFLLIALEEVSWGQRVFRVQTPEFFEQYNKQQETNLHNFAGRYLLHGSYILIGAYSAFAFLVMPKVIPHKYSPFVDLLAPARFLILYFLPVMILYIYYDYLSSILVAQFGKEFGWESGWDPKDGFMIAKDQEPIESLLSLGFLVFMGINKLRQILGKFDSLPKIELRR